MTTEQCRMTVAEVLLTLKRRITHFEFRLKGVLCLCFYANLILLIAVLIACSDSSSSKFDERKHSAGQDELSVIFPNIEDIVSSSFPQALIILSRVAKGENHSRHIAGSTLQLMDGTVRTYLEVSEMFGLKGSGAPSLADGLRKRFGALIGDSLSDTQLDALIFLAVTYSLSSEATCGNQIQIYSASHLFREVEGFKYIYGDDKVHTMMFLLALRACFPELVERLDVLWVGGKHLVPVVFRDRGKPDKFDAFDFCLGSNSLMLGKDTSCTWLGQYYSNTTECRLDKRKIVQDLVRRSGEAATRPGSP